MWMCEWSGTPYGWYLLIGVVCNVRSLVERWRDYETPDPAILMAKMQMQADPNLRVIGKIRPRG